MDKLIVLNFGEDISKMVKIQGNYIKFPQIKKREKKKGKCTTTTTTHTCPLSFWPLFKLLLL
jgi:hypothetical protein